MSRGAAPKAAADDLGTQSALVFALVAERLSAWYEYGQWLKDAQGASLAADWLGRSKRVLPNARLRLLSACSDDLARGIAAALSREAGLHTAHEMMQALDPNYRSDTALALMEECTRRVRELQAES